MANCILLSPEGTYFHRENLAGAAGIRPGYLLQVNGSNEVVAHATADAQPSTALVADISIGDAGNISRVYTDGETVNSVVVSNGAKVTLVLSASQTIAKGAQLASAGNGQVKAPASAGVGVVAIADEAVTTGAGQTAFISATIANF